MGDVSTVIIHQISMSQKRLRFDISMIVQDSLTGYVFEIDLEYTEHLQNNEHIDLSFCLTCDKPPGKQQNKLLVDCVWQKTLYYTLSQLTAVYVSQSLYKNS